jgi:hypothetical protein
MYRSYAYAINEEDYDFLCLLADGSVAKKGVHFEPVQK